MSFESIKAFFSPSPSVPNDPKNESSFKSNEAEVVGSVDFSKLHEAKEPDGPKLNSPVYNVDKKEIDETVRKFDFTQSENFEALASQVLGQGADINAFRQLINSAVQSGVAMATQSSAKIAENAAIEVGSRLQTSLPNSIREIQADALLASRLGSAMQTPAFSHTIQDAKTRIMRANPNATPEQIADLTDKFLTQLFHAAGKDTSPKTVNGFPVQQSSSAPTLAYHEIFPAVKPM